MNWDWIFQAANIWAMAAWGALLLLPRGPIIMSAIFYAAMGMLCLAYTVLLILLQGAWVDPGAQADAAFVSFTSLEGVRAIFASDAGVTLDALSHFRPVCRHLDIAGCGRQRVLTLGPGPVSAPDAVLRTGRLAVVARPA